MLKQNLVAFSTFLLISYVRYSATSLVPSYDKATNIST